MRRLLPLALVLAGCASETEVMLVIKAARTLTTGVGHDIDSITISGEPSSDTVATYNKAVELCSPEMAPSEGCRPEKYVAEGYEGAVTLPLHILMRPGTLDPNASVRVDVVALQTDSTGTFTRKRLFSHLDFKFTEHRRLWLDLPLYAECLDQRACEDLNQFCKADCPPDGNGVVPVFCCGDLTPTQSDDGADPPLQDLSVPIDLTPPPAPADLAIACGHNGESCCPGTPCLSADSECVGGFCSDKAATCGVVGKQCCAAMTTCTGGVCNPDGTCVPPCGGNQQTCCAGAGCKLVGEQCFPDGDLGTCESCGSDMGQCCPGQACGGSLACNGGACQPCGEASQICCTASQDYYNGCATGKPLVCLGSKCVTCGGSDGAPCCTGNDCGLPTQLTCDGNGTCRTCGGATQPCCAQNGNACDVGYTCSTLKCVPCGGSGQLCCAGATPCDTTQGLACDGSGHCAVPSANCGLPGQPCCPTAGGGCTCGGIDVTSFSPQTQRTGGVAISSTTKCL